MITELGFSKEILESYTGEYPLPNRLPKLSRLNVFVGPNNSGKSRLLRGLFSDRGLAGMADHEAEAAVRSSFQELLSYADQATAGAPQVRQQLRDSTAQAAYPILAGVFGDVHRKEFDTTTQNIKNYCATTGGPFTANHSRPIRDLVEKYRQAIAKWQPLTINRATDFGKIPRVYIPSLRGLRTPAGDQARFSTTRTIQDYFNLDKKGDRFKHDPEAESLGSRDKPTVFTGDTLFHELEACLLGDHKARQLVEDFEKYLSKSYFADLDVNLIPKRKADTLLIRIGTEEWLAPNIGDGLQQLVVMSFPLFVFSGKPLLLFIEEPELYLHAGLQLRFVEH